MSIKNCILNSFIPPLIVAQRAGSRLAPINPPLGTLHARRSCSCKLRPAGTGSNIHYLRPLHRQPAYEQHHDGTGLPVSDAIAARILALPMHANLEEADVARIAEVMRAAI